MKKQAYTVKLTLDEINHFNILIRERVSNAEDKAFLKSIFNNLEARKSSEKVVKATQKATEKRTQKAKDKIQNAVNLHRLEGKKITFYSIAEESGVSYNTVRKYLKESSLF